MKKLLLIIICATSFSAFSGQQKVGEMTCTVSYQFGTRTQMEDGEGYSYPSKNKKIRMYIGTTLMNENGIEITTSRGETLRSTFINIDQDGVRKLRLSVNTQNNKNINFIYRPEKGVDIQVICFDVNEVKE